MTNTEMLRKYTDGTAPIEEVNIFLVNNKAGYTLNPDRCTLTAEEIAAAVESVENAATIEDINGRGLADTGTVTKDPVTIVNGKVEPDTGISGFVFIGGKIFRCDMDVLTEEVQLDPQPEPLA